ncbi:MAG TPA: ATP synthase F1 subunit delta [Deltaproteobacteria bacterium]|nr:ATP synthase F1 subunit delta [Deltaproteobacteria bacterium]HPJ94689.1 ATP synthase F1 subunit delta [Deltaproteobacteria bacterium]HPR50358.1 ATP synthase F1 subunit delta [Deltaproteobacteria bacterium]
MKSDVVAKRYARALYELGQEEGLEQKFLEDMQNMALIVDQSKEFRSIMESPLYDIILKKRILKDVVSKIGISEYTANFLNILLDKDRFVFLKDIKDTYKQLLDEASGRVRAIVTCASELDKAQLERIAKTLSEVVKKEVDVDVTVEPSLIGGVIAEIEGKVYDGSVRTQISRLKQSLKGEI